MHAVKIFTDCWEIMMSWFVLEIISNFRLFSEFIQVPSGHKGQVVVLDSQSDGVEGW